MADRILSLDQLKAELDKHDYKEAHFHHTYKPSKKDYDGSDAAALVNTEVKAGQVMLTGQMVDAHYIAEAVRLVRSIEGVTGVESRIVPIGFQPTELLP